MLGVERLEGSGTRRLSEGTVKYSSAVYLEVSGSPRVGGVAWPHRRPQPLKTSRMGSSGRPRRRRRPRWRLRNLGFLAPWESQFPQQRSGWVGWKRCPRTNSGSSSSRSGPPPSPGLSLFLPPWRALAVGRSALCGSPFPQPLTSAQLPLLICCGCLQFTPSSDIY